MWSMYVLNFVPSTAWVFTSIVEVGSEVNSQILFSILLIVTKANGHPQLAAFCACLSFSLDQQVQSKAITSHLCECVLVGAVSRIIFIARLAKQVSGIPHAS